MTKARRKRGQNRFLVRFRRNRVARIAVWGFSVLLFISCFANFIANDRPLVMSYNGDVFFPALFDYRPQDLGYDGFVVDYLALEPEIEKTGWAIYPPLKHRPFEPNLAFEELPAPPGTEEKVVERSDGSVFKTSFWLGTDTAGRDLLTRLIYGCRTSLLMAVAITFIAMIIGITLGSLMGYWGGLFDLIVGRFLETLGYFPIIFMIIILVAFLEEPSLGVLVGIFAVLGTAPFAFYTRGQVLSARKQTYVEAARAVGQKSGGIMFRHILPNAISPILVLVPFQITANITFLATIDFLGFGVQPPTASLGSILRSGYEDISSRWWLVAFSSAVLVVILLLVNFIGDGVREGMDPQADSNPKAFHKWVKHRQKIGVASPEAQTAGDAARSSGTS